MCKIPSLLLLIVCLPQEFCFKSIHFTDFLTKLKVFRLNNLQIYFVVVVEGVCKGTTCSQKYRAYFVSYFRNACPCVGLRFVV
jgi:hypothetical protein